MPNYGEFTYTIATYAAAYYEIGVDAWEKSCKPPYDKKLTVRIAKLLAAITNLSFAAELSFKSMLPEGTEGHKLVDLFKMMESEERISIVNHIIQEAYGKKGDTCNNEDEFMGWLEKCNNNFVEVRYIHEKKNHPVYMPYWFLESLVRKFETNT